MSSPAISAFPCLLRTFFVLVGRRLTDVADFTRTWPLHISANSFADEKKETLPKQTEFHGHAWPLHKLCPAYHASSIE